MKIVIIMMKKKVIWQWRINEIIMNENNEIMKWWKMKNNNVKEIMKW